MSTSTTKIPKHYRKPTMPFIGTVATKLYMLEDRRERAIKAAAIELAAVMGFTLDVYYTDTLPESLANILESHEAGAAVAAAIGFLESKGFAITEVGKSVHRRTGRAMAYRHGPNFVTREPSDAQPNPS